MRLGFWLPLMLGAWALGACSAHRPTPVARANPNPVTPPAGFAYDAFGDAENARFALARRQIVPAENDLTRAVAAAKRLRDDNASLFLTDAALPGSTQVHTRLTDSEALTLLTEAEADVALGRADGADRLLADMEAGVPRRIVPATQPLVRARESLDLAQEAMSSGRYGALNDQLQAAHAALKAYAGQAHAAKVKALAATLAGWLADPAALGRLSLDQPGIWRDQVQGLLPTSIAAAPTPAL